MGEMRVHDIKTLSMAIFLCCFLFIVNLEEVSSKKSPVVSITAENLPRSTALSKMKRSDESSALILDADANEISLEEQPDHLNEIQEQEVQGLNPSSSSSSEVSLEVPDLRNLNQTTAANNNSATTAMKTSDSTKGHHQHEGVDSDVIIGCVIMAVIIVLGLGIGIGLNIYGKRQDTSRDAAEFGIMDDLVEIRHNPDAY